MSVKGRYGGKEKSISHLEERLEKRQRGWRLQNVLEKMVVAWNTVEVHEKEIMWLQWNQDQL